MTKVPAVVVGMDLNGLGLVRSLARAGVPAIAADTDLGKPTMRTRFGRKVRLAHDSGPGLIDELLRLAAGQEEPPVLFLTQERAVETASLHRDHLKAAYRLRMPAHSLLMKLMHKEGVQQLAIEHHAPIAAAVQLDAGCSIANLAEALQFPCILKPSVKDYAYGRRFKKAYRVESLDEAARLYAEIATVQPQMLLQEWIEGGDDDIFFCLQYRGEGGEAVSSFVGRKIRSWPPQVGGTASCTAASDPDDVATAERLTDDFFRRMGFVGMGGVEYKKDRRNGRFVMVEPTVGRTDLQEEVATLNGVNIPLAAYYHELGLPPPEPHPTNRPRIWRDASLDRWSAELQTGAPPDWMRGLPVVDAYWRAYDPGPWLALAAQRLQSRFKRSPKG